MIILKEIAQRLAKLIDVKSLMTLSLTIGFLILTSRGQISSEQFITIFTVIVGFYFGTQVTKPEITDKTK